MSTETASNTAAITSMTRMFEVALGQHGLTIQKNRVLKYLANTAVRSSELTHLLIVPHPTDTKLVDGLVRKGLVKRQLRKADGRHSTLELTTSRRRQLTDADSGLLPL